MAERNNHSAIWLPIAAGMFGVGLALLFAPRSGRETRAKIRSRAKDMKHQAEDSLSSARETIGHGVEQAKDMKERFTSVISHTGQKAKEQVEEMGDEIAQKAHERSSALHNWEEEI